MNELRLLRVIYTALVMSTAIYAFVSWTVFREHTPRGTIEQELHDPVVLGAAIAAILALFAAFALVRVSVEGALRRLRYIVRWALIESVCILALLAAFITFDWRLFLAGWVVTLAAYALSFPTVETR